jgi:hypothetical protein
MYAQIGPKRVADGDSDIETDAIAARNAKLAAQRKTELINYYSRVAKMCVLLARKLRNEKFASALELTSATLLIGDERPRASQYADVIRLLETLAVDAAQVRAAIRIDAPYEPIDVAARAIKIRDAIARIERLASLDAMTGEGTYFQYAPADVRLSIAYRANPVQIIAHEALSISYLYDLDIFFTAINFPKLSYDSGNNSDGVENAILRMPQKRNYVDHMLVAPNCKPIGELPWVMGVPTARTKTKQTPIGSGTTIVHSVMDEVRATWHFSEAHDRLECVIGTTKHVLSGKNISAYYNERKSTAGAFLVLATYFEGQWEIAVYQATGGTINWGKFYLQHRAGTIFYCTIDTNGTVWTSAGNELTAYSRNGDIIDRRSMTNMPGGATVNEIMLESAADDSIWVVGLNTNARPPRICFVSRIRTVSPAAFAL